MEAIELGESAGAGKTLWELPLSHLTAETSRREAATHPLSTGVSCHEGKLQLKTGASLTAA